MIACVDRLGFITAGGFITKYISWALETHPVEFHWQDPERIKESSIPYYKTAQNRYFIENFHTPSYYNSYLLP